MLILSHITSACVCSVHSSICVLMQTFAPLQILVYSLELLMDGRHWTILKKFPYMRRISDPCQTL